MDGRHRLSHDEYVQSIRRNLEQILVAVRANKTTSLVAVREMIGKLRSLIEIEKDPELLLQIGVDSNSDGFPLGSERQYWAADSLREPDEAARQYEVTVRDRVISALERIASKLNSGAPE